GTGGEHGAKVEGWREHADDGGDLVVEPDGAADDGWVGGEAALPESVGEDDRWAAVPAAFGGDEVAAKDRLDAEEAEEVLRDADPDEALGVARADHIVGAVIEEGEVSGKFLEGAIHALPVEVVVDTGGEGGEAGGAGVGDPDQAFRARERQG